MLVMGSSLRVTPAADMPHLLAKRGNKLVIVNLQGTPLDDEAAMRVNCKCDTFMKAVMQKMGVCVREREREGGCSSIICDIVICVLSLESANVSCVDAFH